MSEKTNRITSFVGPSDPLAAGKFDSSRTCNLYVELSPLGAGKNQEPGYLIGTPGLRPVTSLGTGTVRALYTPTSDTRTVYAVLGNQLYQTTDGFATHTLIGSLNTSVGPVEFADNGTGPSDPTMPSSAPSTSVFLVDGQFGYTFKAATPTTTFAVVTDAHFYPSSSISYQDGYFIFNAVNSGYFFVSNINDTTFQSLNTALKSGLGDKIVSVISNNRTIFLLGSQSCEKWWNTGGSTTIIGNFSRVDGWFHSIGCSSSASVQSLNDEFFFVGPNEQGALCVWAMTDAPQRISNIAVERFLQGTTDQSGITAWGYQQNGHWFYGVNAPGVNTTWVWDNSTQLWCERQSYDATFTLGRHLMDSVTYCQGTNTLYAGGTLDGTVYALDLFYGQDGSLPIRRERTFLPLTASLYNFFASMLQVDLQAGVGPVDGSTPHLALEVSKDGGQTFGPPRTASMGRIGKFLARARWHRLGRARDLLLRITCTEPVPVTLLAAYVVGEPGSA